MLRVFSTFSGYGGFELGIMQALGKDEVKIIGHSEVDKNANGVLEYRFPTVKNYGDITKVRSEELPDFDMLVGGSPCQDISMSGKREGLAGERSGLFFQYIRLLKEKQPRYFIWENVKGLLSSCNGWDYARVQIEMAEAGYDIQGLVFNSKYHGVPQNRERVYLVGCLGGFGGREIFPIGYGCKETNELQGQCSNTITTRYENGSNGSYIIEGKQLSQEEGNKEAKTKPVPSLQVINGKQAQGARIYDIDGLAATTSAMGGGHGAKTGLYLVNQPKIAASRGRNLVNGKRKDITGADTEQRLEINENGTSNTLTSVCKDNLVVIQASDIRLNGKLTGKDIVPTLAASCEKGDNEAPITDDIRVRRLTPKECCRLQGLQDDWTRYGIFDGKKKELHDSPRYKLCGNGVTVNVVEYIVRRMVAQGVLNV